MTGQLTFKIHKPAKYSRINSERHSGKGMDARSFQYVGNGRTEAGHFFPYEKRFQEQEVKLTRLRFLACMETSDSGSGAQSSQFASRKDRQRMSVRLSNFESKLPYRKRKRYVSSSPMHAVHDVKLEKLIRALAHSDSSVLLPNEPGGYPLLLFHNEDTNLGDPEQDEDPMTHIGSWVELLVKSDGLLRFPPPTHEHDVFGVTVHQGRCTLDIQPDQGEELDYPKVSKSFCFEVKSLGQKRVDSVCLNVMQEFYRNAMVTKAQQDESDDGFGESLFQETFPFYVIEMEELLRYVADLWHQGLIRRKIFVLFNQCLVKNR